MNKLLPLVIVSLTITGCGGGSSSVSTTSPGVGPSSDWTIPANFVADGGPGKDGIPSLDYPTFISAGQVDYLEDGNLVSGVKVGDVIRAYPHKILNWHEVVNDKYGDQYGVLSHCPLTGTSLGWEVNNTTGDKTFGVSGLLYNSNLIMYDRESDSMWAQMLSKSVRGSKVNQAAKTYQVIDMTWGTWKAMYPDSEVLTDNTGFSRDYQAYPYGSYRTDTGLLFNVETTDTRMHPKEMVLGINVGNTSKVYPLFELAGPLDVINDTVGNTNVVVFGSAAMHMGVAYNRTLTDGTTLEFTARPGELPVVMDDNDGNVWNIHGEAVSGPRQGQKLQLLESYAAMWFAWATIFKNPEIYQN